MGTADRASAYDAMGSVIGIECNKLPSSPSGTAAPKKRHKFTPEQEEILRDFFQDNIEKREAPGKNLVEPLYEKHPQFRGIPAKTIYDKVRNFYP